MDNLRVFNMDKLNNTLTGNKKMQIRNTQVFTFVCGAIPLVTFPVILQRGHL